MQFDFKIKIYCNSLQIKTKFNINNYPLKKGILLPMMLFKCFFNVSRDILMTHFFINCLQNLKNKFHFILINLFFKEKYKSENIEFIQPFFLIISNS